MKKQLIAGLAVAVGLWTATPAFAEGFSSNQSSSGGSSSSSGGSSSGGGSSSSGSSSGSSGTSSSSGNSSSTMKGDTNTVVRQDTRAESGPATSGSQLVGVDGSSSGSSAGGSTSGGSSESGSQTVGGDGGSFGSTQGLPSVTTTLAATPEPSLHVASARTEAGGIDLATIVMSLIMLIGFAMFYRKLPSAKAAA